MRDLSQVAARLDSDGMGYELHSEHFGLTCNHETFQGHYDLWPFCKPYDAEEWWLFIDEQEAKQAAAELTKYLKAVPRTISPSRISFIKVSETAYQLRCNGRICGGQLYKGEDAKTPWPFGKQRDWTIQPDRRSALKAMVRLQDYLDDRNFKLAKTKKKSESDD